MTSDVDLEFVIDRLWEASRRTFTLADLLPHVLKYRAKPNPITAELLRDVLAYAVPLNSFGDPFQPWQSITGAERPTVLPTGEGAHRAGAWDDLHLLEDEDRARLVSAAWPVHVRRRGRLASLRYRGL